MCSRFSIQTTSTVFSNCAFHFVIKKTNSKEMAESSGIKDPSSNLDEHLMSAPAADISHVEQGEAKQSQPTVRDNVLAFCIVFCQLVQVSQFFLISI